MAKKFYNYQSDTLGNVPDYITLRRNSVAADYQIAADGELNFLRYLSASSSSAKAASYNEIPCSGISEAYADIEDIDSSNPTSARLVLFASDSPDNEYGVYNQSATLTLYRRVNGSFTNLGTVSAGFSQNVPQRLLLKVSPGTPNTIQAKVWRAVDPEPGIWSIETTDGSLTLSTGWSGHVGFATGDEVRYRATGFGTDGDPAPREPLPTGITLSVNSLSLSMALDAAELSQSNQLMVDDLQCSTSLDAATLQQANVLSPDDIALNLQMDSAVLVSAGQLSVNVLQLSMALDAAGLQQANQLLVDDLLLTSSLVSPDLSVGLTLVPDSVWLATLLDQVSLTQSHVLTVDDLAQSLSIDNVTLTIAGQVIGPGTLTIGISGPSISIGITP